MNETAPLGGGAAASADEERSKKPFNNLAAPTPQYPAKHVYRAAAPLRCCGSRTWTAPWSAAPA